mmetsp:Transcript_30332/g.65085  ORF Transcript_30332/g.65085 Transcript_30332/m.65085 type:complete len:222 (-) Transcript_30332:144-809(-)
MANIVVSQSTVVLQRLCFKGRALILDRNSERLLHFLLNILDGILWSYNEFRGGAVWGLHSNLHRLQIDHITISNIVFSESISVVLQGHISECWALILDWNTKLLFHSVLDIANGEIWLYEQFCDGTIGGLNLNLHWFQIDHITMSNIIISQCSAILDWCSLECRALIHTGHAKHELHLLLYIVDCLIWNNTKFRSTAFRSLNCNLHRLQVNRISMTDLIVS